MDSGYEVVCLSHALADLPVVLVGRLRSDRVMLRDPGPARSALAGSAQIMQLRATARKHRRAHHRAVKAEAKDSSKARR